MKNPWESSEKESPLDDYESKLADRKEVTLEDLREMKEKGIPLEQYLQFLKNKYHCFFHGSRNKIPPGQEIGADIKKKIFVTDEPAVAILKAIYSNIGVRNLGYPYKIDPETPMKLVIEGVQPKTIGEKGYVYVILEKEGFWNEPEGSWQFTKEGGQKFEKIIEVEKSDFKYPVEIKE